MEPPPVASSAVLTDTQSRATASPGAVLRHPRTWLVLYAGALAAIAFWPTPVDQGAGGLLQAITRAVPWLTYEVIEATANVLLFVPLGILLAVVLPRRRWLVLPLALVVTALIESAQALFLTQRTASMRDVVANLAGAAIGLALVLVIERVRRRTRR